MISEVVFPAGTVDTLLNCISLRWSRSSKNVDLLLCPDV